MVQNQEFPIVIGILRNSEFIDIPETKVRDVRNIPISYPGPNNSLYTEGFLIILIEHSLCCIDMIFVTQFGQKQNETLKQNELFGIHPAHVQRQGTDDTSDKDAVVKPAAFRNALNNVTLQRMTPIMLPECVKMPFSLGWLPTNCNIAVADGKGLENIPYINDEVIEKEMGFIEELIELNGNSNTNFKGLPYLRCTSQKYPFIGTGGLTVTACGGDSPNNAKII